MGSRGFYYAAPASWNALLPLLRDLNLSLVDFRLMLKIVVSLMVSVFDVLRKRFL